MVSGDAEGPKSILPGVVNPGLASYLQNIESFLGPDPSPEGSSTASWIY